MKNLNRCLKCGHNKIKFKDCGYSSFNPGSATCTNCNTKISVSDCDSLNPEKDLTIAWNKANPLPKKAIANIEEKIQMLKKEKQRIKKL